MPQANAVVMQPGAQILANANVTGDGGHVVLWSDLVTKVNGSISAMGGSQSGNGGLIETSSKQDIEVDNATINTLAPHGTTGLWLLDPTDVTIVSGSTDTNAVYGAGVYQPNDGTIVSSIGVQNLVAQLNTTDVLVTTTAVTGTGGGNGDITVTTPINWSGATTLTLNAFRDININLGGNITASSGNLQLIAGNVINLNDFINVSGTVSMTADTINLGANVTSGSDQDYASTTAMNLTASAILESTGGGITLESNTAGLTGAGFSLTINAVNESMINLVINSLDFLYQEGSGDLQLNQVNTYTGTTQIDNGSITIFNNNSLGDDSANLVINAGTLILGTTGLNLNQNITMNAGSTIIDNNFFSANQLNGAFTLDATGDGTVTFDVNDILGPNTSTLYVTGAVNSVNGVTLNKIGNSALVFTNATNSFSGNTNVNAGSLILASNQGYGNTTINAATGAMVELSGNSLLISNTFNFADGSFLTDGSVSANNTLQGLITIANTGTLTITVTDSGTNLNFSGIVNGTGVTINEAASGTVTIGGIGAANHLSGTYNLQSGALQIEKQSSLGTLNLIISDGAELILNYNGLIFSNTVSVAGSGLLGAGGIVDVSTNSTDDLGNTITLTANDTVISVNDPNTTLLLGGNILDGGNGYGFTKSGSGTVLIDGSGNSFGNASNGVTVNQGLLIATDFSNVLGVPAAQPLLILARN